jgi:hypothetical protein
MRERTGPIVLYAALAAVVLGLSGIAGYVYRHEPVRDVLAVQVESTPVPSPATVSGLVVGVEGDTYVLVTASGAEVTLTIPAGAPVEDLQRLAEALVEGVTVNVGVENTTYGQVLTGIVVIDDDLPPTAGAVR